MATNKIARTIFSFFILCVALSTNAQSELKRLLIGKTTLSEIMEVVDKYYRDHPEEAAGIGEESKYLHWKRWEWYMSGRLGHGGQFVNISERLMDGLRQKERMDGPRERNINSGWTFVGPSSSSYHNPDATGNGIGRVDRITFHPTDSTIIFIGTPAGGLWGTLNDGLTWNNLTDNLPSIGISGFIITPSNTSIMYLLTGDGDSNITGFVEDFGYMRQSIGVLKSTDGGVSWHQTGTFPGSGNPFVGYRLIQNPVDPEILLAATSSGLYRTTNGGETWIKELALRTYDVAFKPGDPTIVYASVHGDFWRSTNGGSSWTSNSTYDIDPGDCFDVKSTCAADTNQGGRIKIAIAPSSPGKVYLLAGPVTASGQFCGLWLSTDSGLTFTRQSNTPNIFGTRDNGGGCTDFTQYDLAMACRPNLSTSVVAAGCTVWRSTNGGSSWTHSTSYGEDGASPYIHPDVHDLAYNPLDNDLYAATDGGLYKSVDHGVTWTNLSNNIEASQFYHMAGWDGNINKLMGGLQDNGVKYRSGNNSAFNHMSGGDGFDVLFNPDTGEPAYATVNDYFVTYSNNGEIDTAKYQSQGFYFQNMAIHNSNPDTIFMGNYGIHKSIDGGVNWTFQNASGSWALTSCPSNSARFYSAGGVYYSNGTGALYFSGNTGEDWTDKSDNFGFPDEEDWVKITDVAVMPNNSSFVWASFGGFDAANKVVMSTNTGDTWANLTFNLPNVPVNCLAIDSDNGAYAGTDIGVFYLGPTVSEWMPWSNGLPNVPVTELLIFDDGVNKKIRAATFGRGVWQSNLAETCDPAVIVTGGLEGLRHYEASNSISSSSIVQGGIGTFVSFQSGNYITLTENFMVIDDSEFLGFISPCGEGGIPSAQGGDPVNRANPNSSIILLRRMWDPEDGMPYGSIDVINVTNNTARISFRTKKPGKVEVVAARQIQDKLSTLYSSHTSAGKHSMEIDVSSLPREFHYLLLFYEGKLVHYQEIDLREE